MSEDKKLDKGELDNIIKAIEEVAESLGREVRIVQIDPDATDEEIEAMFDKLRSENRTDN